MCSKQFLSRMKDKLFMPGRLIGFQMFAFMGLCAVQMNVLADSLDIPHVYSNGQRLTADNLNNNMAAVKDAVDDNDVRITALETATGAVSIGHTAFQNDDNSESAGLCNLYKGGFGTAYFSATAGAESASCDMVVGVSLPHGKTLTGLSCSVLDNTALTTINARLWRTNLTDGSYENIFTTPDTTTDSGSLVVLSDITLETANTDVVDNVNYAYNLFVNFSASDFTTIGADAQVYGCSITYQ